MEKTVGHISIDEKSRTIDLVIPDFGYTEENPYYIGWDTLDDHDWIDHLRGKIWWNDSLERGLQSSIQAVKGKLKHVRKS